MTKKNKNKLIKDQSSEPQVALELPKIKGVRFIPTNHRRFLKIDLDYTNENLFDIDPKELIGDVNDAILQVNVRIKQEDLPRLDLKGLKEATKGAYHCRDINPVIVKEKVVRIQNIVANISPKKAVKLFIEAHKPNNANSIKKYAISVMERVGVSK